MAAGGSLRVVVGISGGIAAYKAVGIARLLVLAGHEVYVVATAAALRFVGAPTLEAISGNPVATDLFENVDDVTHVALGQSADVIVVAPATANTIAKMALGLADDLLGTTVLASHAPVVVAPAMHTEMWEHPATRANVATLRDRGAIVVGPAVGRLTGADTGAGRMAEPDEIVAAALSAARHERDLLGRRIVVTAGGTREPLDPVRYLGNRSSGKQGVALAEAARARGADVTLIGCHLEVPAPAGMRVVEAGTALELRDAVGDAGSADVVIMAAAVADYRPELPSDEKLKRDPQGDSLTLTLVQNPDILAELGHERHKGRLVVGFAAETEDDPERLLAGARAKQARKHCDLLVVNRVGWNRGFASDENDVVIIDSAGDIVMEAAGSKLSVAHRILDAIVGV